MKKWLVLAVLALVPCLAAGAARAEDTLAAVKQKGTLVVGVKNDYKPWGFIDPSGQIVGLEIDLAREVADKIGVKMELVPVTAVNRMEF
ncbi:MAG TPA: transporter substrate-binding domain-containing protein, partial [Stellaceae bacterium]|nr:transporter substrate-binding domain-containing protein [Stellaceae bacterium]